MTPVSSPRRVRVTAALTVALLPLLAMSPLPSAQGVPQAVSQAESDASAPGATASAEVGYAAITPAATGTLLPQTAFVVNGVLGNKLPRKVVLTHTASGVTRTLATTRSSADGLFTFEGVRVPSTGALVAVSPEQTVQVAAGDEAQARHRRAVRKVADLVKVVQNRRQARVKAAKRLAAAGRGTSARKKGRLLRAAGKAKIKLRVARKALARARGRVVVTEAALVRRVVVRRAESKPVTVTVVAKQGSSVAALPPVAQAGPTAATPATGAVVAARFTPARPGRTVRLEEMVGDQWRSVATQPQDRSGHAVFRTQGGSLFRAVALATDEAPQVVTTEVRTRSWKPEFSDGFGGSVLDPSRWVAQERPLGTGLRSCARTDASSHRVGGGVLRMGVSRDPARSGRTCEYVDKDGVKHQLPYMRNTQLATLGRYDYRYGFAAARIKVQAAIGMHSAFWSQPLNATVPGRPEAGVEVDVMEYFGDYPREDGVASFQHVLQPDGSVVKAGRLFPETALMKADAPFSANYHVFSLEWTPDRYVFRVDGREYHRATRDISRSPQFLLLSNLTSSYELVNLENFDDVASVDWVQVWK